ncbi:MAG: hypothetical protein OEU92_22085, partial [Alphaproteobacteria bacterium]|nr:hypothetical protein [Alphaproteobacteria bacterium]
KSYARADPPVALAKALLASTDRWKEIPALNSISEGPIITPGGRLICTSGLDQETSILFDISDIEVSVPDHPTKEDARAALDELLELLSEFAFADGASRSVALCELLTPFVRPLLPAAPMFINEAPKAGSGKSQLARVSGLLATGRAPAVMNQPENAESEAKRLFSMLMEGASVAVIDNIERPLRSDLLCSILTEPTIRDRVLGASKTATVPTASTWIATGNNLRVVGDLTRRVLSCMIDAGVERPEERAFKRNLDQYTLDHRAQLVSAALTVVKAYLVAGERVEVTPFNSFGVWSAMVREPLVWLGEADPCSTRTRISERDPIAQGLGNFLEVWDSLFGEEPMTAGAVLQVVNSGDSEQPDIEEVFRSVTGDGRMPNAHQLGRYLTRFEGRIERGRKIVKDGTRKRASVWKLVKTPDSEFDFGVSLRVSAQKVPTQKKKNQKEKGSVSSLQNNLSGRDLLSQNSQTHPVDLTDASKPDSNEKPTGGSIVI